MLKTYLYLMLSVLLVGVVSVFFAIVFSEDEREITKFEAQKRLMQSDPKNYPTTGGDEISVDFGK